MKNVRLIATDLDHTLLTEDSQLPPHFGDYLDALAQRHILFVAASGRPLYTLQAQFPHYRDKIVIAADNGAVIADHGQIIAKNTLPTADLLEMCQFVTEQTTGHPLMCGIDGAVGAEADAIYDAAYRKYYYTLNYIPDLQDYQGEADKMTLFLPDFDAERVCAEQLAPRYGAKYNVTVTGKPWIDIVPEHINKGIALAQIGRQRHIAPDNMMAFGDTFNDAEMLKFVKYSYLVANANPGMAPYADYRTASNEAYGVVQVIKQVIAAQV